MAIRVRLPSPIRPSHASGELSSIEIRTELTEEDWALVGEGGHLSVQQTVDLLARLTGLPAETIRQLPRDSFKHALRVVNEFLPLARVAREG
jgi:hypothetical protein